MTEQASAQPKQAAATAYGRPDDEDTTGFVIAHLRSWGTPAETAQDREAAARAHRAAVHDNIQFYLSLISGMNPRL